LVVRLHLLLAEHDEAQKLFFAPLVGEERDVVARARGGPEAVYAARGDRSIFHDAIEQPLSVVEELARGVTVLRVLQDRGKFSAQLPGREEERPVDVIRDLLERDVVDDAPPDERRLLHLAGAEREDEAVRARGLDRQDGLVLLVSEEIAEPLL